MIRPGMNGEQPVCFRFGDVLSLNVEDDGPLLDDEVFPLVVMPIIWRVDGILEVR